MRTVCGAMDRRVVDNMGWLVFSKVVRFGGGLVIGVWLARYLGPEAFGLLSFALAMTAVFAVLAGLGLHDVLVRECVTCADRRGEILGTALVLHLLGSLVSWAAIVLIVQLVGPAHTDMQALIIIVSAGLLVQASCVTRAWFEARVQARPVVLLEISAFLVVSVLRCALIVLQAPIMMFAWLIALEACLVSLGLLVLFNKRVRPATGFSISSEQALHLLRSAWPLMVSGLAIMVYARTDQLMLGHLIDPAAVGLYSVALWLSEGWYILPIIIVSSVFPGLLRAGSAESNASRPVIDSDDMQRLLDWLASMGLALAATITVLAPWLIILLFGAAYASAVVVLQLHVWSMVFVFLGVAGHKWLLAERLQHLFLYRTLLGAGLNIALNLLLIPRYGIVGAAVATLITQAVVSVGFDALHARTRLLFSLNCHALVFGPIRVGRGVCAALRYRVRG